MSGIVGQEKGKIPSRLYSPEELGFVPEETELGMAEGRPHALPPEVSGQLAGAGKQ